MKPFVSILIPAYDAEKWLAGAIKSAIAQTWQQREIIVLDDGSHDRTKEIAEGFAPQGVKIVSTENQGSAGARNGLLRLCKGDYIQWLDADDLLAPDKIELQIAALGGESNPRILLSGPWGFFNYRTRYAQFVSSPLWNHLSPIEWLLQKMGGNHHMQTATWLTSRELTEAAGPWDTRLQSDDDGEYFCRVLLASCGTHFVPEARVFYRRTPSLNRVSYIGNSDDKKDSMLVSMKLHVQYLLALENSQRTRKACLHYMQTWFENFYPERPDLVAQLQAIAEELGGHLDKPYLRRKYAWIRPILGWKHAKRAQRIFPQLKSAALMRLDKIMYNWESRKS